MITLLNKTDDGQTGHYFSFSGEEKHGLLYLKDIETDEFIKLPQELFCVKYLAGKNILSANFLKDKLELRIKDKRKKGSALFLLTSLSAKDFIKPFLCGDIKEKSEWIEYLKETDDIDFLSPVVQEVSNKIIKEKGLLLGNNRNCYTRASSAFNWVRNNISYSILPRYAVEQMATTIRSLPKENHDVYTILRMTFKHLSPAQLMEVSSKIVIPCCVEDPYQQALYITTKFGKLWKLFFYTWEGKKTRSASKTIVDKTGKCDCFSNVFVALCRSMGIPAMRVNGYLNDEGNHAWSAVYLSPFGWIEVDPTNAGSFFHFNRLNYFYEFLRPEFKGEKYILPINKSDDKNCLARCKSFYKKADEHPSVEEMKAVLYKN